MTMWWIGPFGDNYYSDAQVSVVKDFGAWTSGRAPSTAIRPHLTIDGMVVLGDENLAANNFNYSQGINFDDYMTQQPGHPELQDRGMFTGIEAPFMSVASRRWTPRYSNCYLVNRVDIDLTPARSVNAASVVAADTDHLQLVFAHPASYRELLWTSQWA